MRLYRMAVSEAGGQPMDHVKHEEAITLQDSRHASRRKATLESAFLPFVLTGHLNASWLSILVALVHAGAFASNGGLAEPPRHPRWPRWPWQGSSGCLHAGLVGIPRSIGEV